jgi:hypothetical protein
VPHLRCETSKQVLARIQRLCCLGIGGEMLMPHLMREVTKLVPSRGGLFYRVGPNFEFTNCYTTYSAAVAELYFKEFYATRAESRLLRPLYQFNGRPMSNPVVQLGQHLVVDLIASFTIWFTDRPTSTIRSFCLCGRRVGSAERCMSTGLRGKRRSNPTT